MGSWLNSQNSFDSLKYNGITIDSYLFLIKIIEEEFVSENTYRKEEGITRAVEDSESLEVAHEVWQLSIIREQSSGI
jgi:hypothetical protein